MGLRSWLRREPDLDGSLASHLAHLLPRLKVNCVIDVGANAGQFGRLLRDAGYRRRIVSLEPVRGPYAKLAAEAARDPEWFALPLALGSAPERKTIHVARSNQFASFRAASEYGERVFADHIDTQSTEEVEVSTLDVLWPRAVEGMAAPVVYLKLDTQGYDLEVLRGAPASLPLVVGLQTELAVEHIYEGMPDWLSVIAELRRMGFRLTGLFPVSREPHGLPIVELDGVFVR